VVVAEVVEVVAVVVVVVVVVAIQSPEPRAKWRKLLYLLE
jgi:hypothetical protein